MMKVNGDGGDEERGCIDESKRATSLSKYVVVVMRSEWKSTKICVAQSHELYPFSLFLFTKFLITEYLKFSERFSSFLHRAAPTWILTIHQLFLIKTMMMMTTMRGDSAHLNIFHYISTLRALLTLFFLLFMIAKLCRVVIKLSRVWKKFGSVAEDSVESEIAAKSIQCTLLLCAPLDLVVSHVSCQCSVTMAARVCRACGIVKTCGRKSIYVVSRYTGEQK